MIASNRRTPRLRALAAWTVAALALAPCAVLAQSDAERIRDLERRLEKSLDLIGKLERRVNELERGRAATPVAPAVPSTPAQEARIEALEQSVSQIAVSRGAADTGLTGVAVHGFADAGYEYTTLRSDDRRPGFVLGNLDLFFTPGFGRVKTLAELNFEVEREGGLATDLERLQLGYTVSDNLTAWLGRFHTPYGYWNNAFHHGAQIQTAVTRPRFIDFEDKGGILPAHSVGAWLTGRAASHGGRWVYDAWLANGGRVVDGVLDFNAFRDNDNNKAVGFNAGYQFGGALDGLLLGVHGLRENIDVYAGDERLARTRVAMLGGYFYLDRDNWEAIGEYYRFRDRDLDQGTTHASWAGFAQVGYTLGLWTPYYRWEKTSLDQGDPYFAAQDSGRPYTGNVLGLRYAVNANTAFKVEGMRTREKVLGEDASYTEWRAQLAVRF